MKPIFFLAAICFAATLHAQSAASFIQTGDSLYEQAAYEASAKAYKQAFAISEASATDYYNAACSAALSGKHKQAFSWLEKSAEKGWRNLAHLNRDSDLSSLHDLKAWSDIQALVQANLDEYEKNLDKPLKAQLEQIYVRDQTLRQLYRDAEDKFGRESEEMKYFWALVAEEDSLNELEVIEILEEKGWVGRSVVGGKANMTVWLVIQHAPLETQEKYLPMLRESVKQGESQGSHLALLEDRIQMRNGKPQIYGSQITRDETSDKQIVYPVLEPEYVNQRRAEVGLGPIEEYVKRWDIEWTVEQKEK